MTHGIGQWRRSASRPGMLMNGGAKNSFVVPANAGTHNHRCWRGARVSTRVDSSAQTDKSEAMGLGVRRDDKEGVTGFALRGIRATLASPDHNTREDICAIRKP
jgi:hypothetical protein